MKGSQGKYLVNLKVSYFQKIKTLKMDLEKLVLKCISHCAYCQVSVLHRSLAIFSKIMMTWPC